MSGSASRPIDCEVRLVATVVTATASATLLVWVLGVVHTIGAGTDGQRPWLLAVMGAGAAVILPLLALRLGAVRRRARPALRAAS